MDANLGIPKKVRKEVAQKLMQFLSDTYVLYLKTQNFHWNVTGDEFFSLHILFEKHYGDMADAIDELAERIRALGFFVHGSFSSFSKNASIKEENRILSARQMLKSLVDAHEKMSKNGHPFIIKAQEDGDNVTADMIIKRLNFHEKAAWMLRSHLEKLKK